MKRKKAYNILLSAVLCVLFVSYANATVSVGKFTYIEGQVDILKEGKLPAVSAKVGDAISVKDVIRTKSGAKAEVTFNDGNILKIAPKSRLDISEYLFDGTSKVVLDLPRGKVEANVDKRVVSRISESPQANKFEIRTPVAVAGVRGTQYFTFHERGVTGILVKEGKVEVYNPKFPDVKVIVPAGQVTTVAENKPPQAPRPATEAEKKGHEKDVAPEDKPKDKPKDKAEDDKPAEPKIVEAAAPAAEAEGARPVEIVAREESPTEPALPPPPPPVFVDPMVTADTLPPLLEFTYVPPPPPPPPITETTETTTTTTETTGGLTTTYNFVSDIRGNNFSGTIETASSIWSATSSNPASMRASGDIVTRRGMLDIHAADQGYWTTLLPGNVTHTNENQTRNYIVDERHPVTSNLTDDDYSWQYVSTGHFTNLYSGTNTILKDDNNRPTTIEYLYNNVNVLATMQTLEMLYEGGNGNPPYALPLKNTLAYTLRKAGIMPGYGKLLLLRDRDPWNSTAIQNILYSWGINNYDIKTSAEFASLDLSPYSAIVIASDQTNTFYTNMANNISKLENFSAPGYTPTFISEIYSSNRDNQNKTTYDGGAYRGYVLGTELNNALDGRMYALYIDPSGNAGILKGSFSGTVSGTTWSTEGSMYPIEIVPNIGITPQNLYSSWDSGDVDYKYGDFGSGGFSGGGGSIVANSIFIEGANIERINGSDEKWGVWNAITSGTYSGTTSDSWTFSAHAIDFDSNRSSYSWTLGLEITGTKWSGNKLEGSIHGYWADACLECTSSQPETGIFVGETLGTFEPNKWQAVQAGAWMETNKLLLMACPNDTCNTTGSNLTAAQQALKNLNIPVVEVGRANFSGSGNNLTVNMNDVIFLANQSGQKATMWATGSVSGSYNGTPTTGTAVTLSGSAGSVSFTPQVWQNNKWLATINGTGINLGSAPNNSLIMNGAGAGTYTGTDSGTFSGTAVGTVK